MRCANTSCHTEASVHLSRNVNRPAWFCAYCAAKTLEVVNPFSFLKTSEMSYEQEKAELAKHKKTAKTVTPA